MHGDTHAFIVRIWHEALDGEGNVVAWRGSIEHVGGHERLSFQDLTKVVRFIQEKTGVNNQGSGCKWRWLLARIRT